MEHESVYRPYFEKRGRRFVNPHITSDRRGLVDFVRWQLGHFNDSHMPPTPPTTFTYPNPDRPIKLGEPKVMWIGHCSFFISIDEVNILTDPVWGERCSPVQFFGPKRRHAPPLDVSELPSIDYVLISHNHYDHLDESTVRQLNALYPDITWIVPLGVSKWFKRRGIRRVTELTWWEHVEMKPEVSPDLTLRITSVPTQHFSGRGIFDTNTTLWCGFVVDAFRGERGDKRFYFVGDTGYNPIDFKAIGRAFSGMDLSLIPIGTYVPHAFMDPVHIDPVRATAIHTEVGSKLSVGMHWNTFRLSGEGRNQPPYDLYLKLREEGVDPSTFRILDPGQMINW
jgi:N-acyl-phosphatidylethanolamine-hydrolysing phospholipase D